MNDFNFWISIGFGHIIEWGAYDHILFLIGLCGVYKITEWRNVLINITAFTVGHSLTLALSVLNIIKIDGSIIEFIIPFTILVISFNNIRNSIKGTIDKLKITYWTTCFFGLIHGLGFSFLLREMLGHTTSIVWPLVAFNIGIELGQFLIVIGIILFSLTLTSIFNVKQKAFNVVISITVFAAAIFIAIDRFLEIISK